MEFRNWRAFSQGAFKPRGVQVNKGFIGLLTAALVVSGHAQREYRAKMRSFGPVREIVLARPEIRWEIWALDKQQITSTKLRLNGKLIDSRYVEEKRSVIGSAPASLVPGSYTVEAEVTVSNSARFTKSWTFVVSEQATDIAPRAGEKDLAIMATVNRYRADLGLKPMEIDDRFMAAARAHADYLKLNDARGHYEKRGLPGFIGVDLAERMGKFGIVDAAWEVTATQGPSADASVRAIFDAPYHRLAFMTAGSVAAGASVSGDAVVITGSIPMDSRVVVSPAPGQRDIPLSWRDNENPSPSAVHGLPPSTFGYPVVYHLSDPDNNGLKIQSMTLEERGKVLVPTYQNRPENDPNLTSTAFFLPKQPLKPSTIYVVTVNATTGDGKDISRSWTFSTVDAPQGR